MVLVNWTSKSGEHYHYYIDKWVSIQLDKVKKLITEKDRDWVCVIDGEEGCLAGDTEIQISRFKLSRRYTIEKLYQHFHEPDKLRKHFDLKEPSRVRCFNGKEIRLHTIKDVKYSGIKQVYLVVLENGLSIKTTKDHKFLTKDNLWVQLQNLNLGQEIMCDTLHSHPKNRKRIKLYDIQLRVGKNHPYCSTTGRVEVHRLIYEARLNNIDFINYLDILLNEPELSKTLKFIDTSKYEVHHIDNNHYNNSIDNLKLLSKEEHRIEHGSYSNFSQGVPKFVKIKHIDLINETKTYDIECEEPYHNFVANGIVVHNSGKSKLASQMAKYLDPTFDETRMCMTPDEFYKQIINAKKGQAVVFDEAFTGLSAKTSLSKINKLLVEMMMEMRKKNLFAVIVLPSVFYLEKYVVLHRARALFHCFFKKNSMPGKYAIYTKEQMKALKIYGNRTMSYRKPTIYKYGEFYNNNALDWEAYEIKKITALHEKRMTKLEIRQMNQRNALLFKLYCEHQSLHDTGEEVRKLGLDMDDETVANGIRDYVKLFPDIARARLPKTAKMDLFDTNSQK
jgi:hypothetical protein